jgi:hypothetical protein
MLYAIKLFFMEWFLQDHDFHIKLNLYRELPPVAGFRG